MIDCRWFFFSANGTISQKWIHRLITCIALHISKRSVSLSERKKLFYKTIKSNDSAASAVPCRRKEQTTVVNM